MAKENGKVLKDYDAQLLAFLIINVVVFICLFFYKNISVQTLNQSYSNINSEEGIIAGGVGTLIVFVLKGLLSSDFKASLVFWRIKNPYPGCRVFTKIGRKDCRIDFAVLEKEYEKLPEKPDEQNKLWYKLSRKHKDDDMIFRSHRDYLYSRDLTGLAFLFLLFYSSAAIFITKDIKSVWVYLLGLLVQYLVLSVVGQIYGRRFACNVLAKESSTLK